uniref:Uncharacterized protein n=1 Tax=viral metagenome TaxID=1070528 RepID=A0A6M3M0Z0_9ZZZZ
MWLITEGGNWIEVKPSVIKSDNIIPQPAIRYGKPYVEGKPIELVQNATFPVFREDHADLIKTRFAEIDFTAEKLFPDDEIAETRYSNLIGAIVTVSQDIPLASYTRQMVDRKLRLVEEHQKYQVAGIDEGTGREILTEFPYLTKTHQIREWDDEGNLKVLPRIYYDLWLTEKLYELKAQDDAGRFELVKLMEKLENYPFPVYEEGSPKFDGDGEPMISYEEGMLYFDGYVASTGSSQQYHAFIVPNRVQAEDGEKFVFEMKLAKTIKKFTNLMDVPQEGEVPVTVPGKQKPLVMSSVAEMLLKVKV